MKNSELLNSIAAKTISLTGGETSRKQNVSKNVRFSYWNTYVSIEKGRNFDYMVVPMQDAGSLYHVSVKFEKLTEEEISFLLENWSSVEIIFQTSNFRESEKGVYFDSFDAGQKIFLDENVSYFSWSH
jgi:hypothetical protein